MVGDTDWVYPTLQNEWTNYNNAAGTYERARYKKRNGVVYIEGLIKSGTSKNDGGLTPIFVLPTGFRPKKQLCFTTTSSATGYCNRIDVYANGVVQSITGDNGYLSLCLCFIAEQ